MKELFLVGRILVGGYYIMNAVSHFTGVDRMAGYAASKGVPLPSLAIIVTGLLLLVAGLSILLGIVPRIGIAALVLFFVPVTFMMHQFWREDGMRRATEMINFTKNIGLLGSALMFLAIPLPWPYSLAQRVRILRRAHV